MTSIKFCPLKKVESHACWYCAFANIDSTEITCNHPDYMPFTKRISEAFRRTQSTSEEAGAAMKEMNDRLAEKPIKLVTESNGWTLSVSNDDYEIILSRKLSLKEVADLFDISVDVLQGKIGVYTLDGDEGNDNE